MKQARMFFAVVVGAALVAACTPGSNQTVQLKYDVDGVTYTSDESSFSTSVYLNDTVPDVFELNGNFTSSNGNANLLFQFDQPATMNTLTVYLAIIGNGFVNYSHSNGRVYEMYSARVTLQDYVPSGNINPVMEGTFGLTLIGQTPPYDTLTVTNGYFYNNNF